MLVVLVTSSAARAGEFSFHPSVAVSEDYSDNVYETRDNRRSDFISRFMPGLALKYNAPLWDWDLAYNFDYRLYARNSRNDDSTHNLAAKGHINIIDELFFLDLSDTYKRVSLDVSRDYTQESLYANQTDSNTFVASPYFVFHPGTRTTIKTGYRYSNVWYRDPAAIDKREHSGFLNASYAYSSKLTFNADYLYTRQDSINPYNRNTPSAGARYEYADKCFVFGNGGYTWIDYRDSPDFNSPYWNAGITHAFDTFTLTASAGVQYPEDPLTGLTRETNYVIALNKPLDRGSIGLSVSYSDYKGENVDRPKRYGIGFTGKYALTEKLGSSLTANVDRYDYRDPSGNTRRIYITPGLTYSLPWETNLSLSYSFIDYHSVSRYADNYEVSRVVLEVRKTF
ncbi:MAG: TIGR03016 family PEP-CTERM system-associated outer membrane protein [Geobacteraceae bacterium]|nr:TIGR03016 family PEP-CTERM system-associated outer membrane protein [Geobacteraceae bacterium]